jgi:hypothetical protein
MQRLSYQGRAQVVNAAQQCWHLSDMTTKYLKLADLEVYSNIQTVPWQYNALASILFLYFSPSEHNLQMDHVQSSNNAPCSI